MNPFTPQCRSLYKTIYRVEYYPHSIQSKPLRAKIPVSEDPLIIDGHCANNLNINNKPLPKTLSDHPTIKPTNEDYFSFVGSLEKRSKVLYDRFFKDVEIDKDYIEKEIRDINTTEYQYKYSPNEFLPLSGYVRLLRKNLKQPDKWKFHDTTYMSCYSRIVEYDDLQDVVKSEDFRDPGRRPVADEINRIYRTGRSIYQTSYSGEHKDHINQKLKA